MYSFVPEPVPEIDIETSNWFASTHPRSIFTRSLVIASHDGDSRSLLMDVDGALTLVSRTPAEQTVTVVERASIPSLLAHRFGLPGWALDPETGCPIPTPAS
jgi:arylamine N-acetyltransferase